MAETNDTSRLSENETAESTTNTQNQADGGMIHGPHDTPQPLPTAATTERTLFQTPVDAAHCQLNPSGGRTELTGDDAAAAGIRVWVSNANGEDPTPRVSLAVEDDVIQLTASVWPTIECLQALAQSLRLRPDEPGEVEIDSTEVQLSGVGGSAEVVDDDSNGLVSVYWDDRFDSVGVSVSTGESWVRINLDDRQRDQLAFAAETAAEVIGGD